MIADFLTWLPLPVLLPAELLLLLPLPVEVPFRVRGVLLGVLQEGLDPRLELLRVCLRRRRVLLRGGLGRLVRRRPLGRRRLRRDAAHEIITKN